MVATTISMISNTCIAAMTTISNHRRNRSLLDAPFDIVNCLRLAVGCGEELLFNAIVNSREQGQYCQFSRSLKKTPSVNHSFLTRPAFLQFLRCRVASIYGLNPSGLSGIAISNFSLIEFEPPDFAYVRR